MRVATMNDQVNFCGASGASYSFRKLAISDDWAKVAGVILFAAGEGASFRVISISEQGGVTGDIGAFWRWREARRYGATTIYARPVADIGERRTIASDLFAGLDPVCAEGCEASQMAA
jgi:hypothetical protein